MTGPKSIVARTKLRQGSNRYKSGQARQMEAAGKQHRGEARRRLDELKANHPDVDPAVFEELEAAIGIKKKPKKRLKNPRK